MVLENIHIFKIRHDATIKDAMQQLTEQGIKILCATDENQRVVGTLTDGDIRRGISNGRDLKTGIKGIMNRRFFCINGNEQNAKQKAEDLMKRHLIEYEYVPIVDDQGRLTDIVSWHDYILAGPNPSKKCSWIEPVVIMAGGRGVRLDPFTKILPKPLIPLGEKPILEVIMDRFYGQGFHQFKVIINHKKEIIKLYFSENKQSYELELIEENEYCGTVGGLYLLKDKIQKTFILTNCDTLLEGDYGDFLNWHAESRNLITIIGSHKEVAVPYGVLDMNNGSLIKMIEKPKFDLFVNTGTYVMEPEVFDYIHSNENIDIDKLILKIQSHKANKVGVFPCWGKWLDTGQWDEYKNTLKTMGIEN
ncbi:MAG: CBS domain-containing protein [Desulfobacteraceae bacterium]|nr:MAG: CBS domain-containing protein [Desulfobacteraceae bacterium]